MKNIVFFIILLLIPFTSCRWLKEKGILGRKTDTLALWQARQDSLRIADSLKAVQERVALENERIEAERQAEFQRLEWARKYKYNIITGSFVTPEFASRLLEKYKSQGYTDARIIPLEGTRFEMVAVEAHEKAGTAVKRLEHFKDSAAFDSWIYVFTK